MSIKAKILALVLASALLACAITGMALSSMSEYKTRMDEYRHASQTVFNGEHLNRLVLAAAVEMRGIYMVKTRAEVLDAADRVVVRSKALEAFLNDWQARLKPGELPEFAQVKKDCLGIVRGGFKVAQIAREQSQAAADAMGNKPQHSRDREAKQARIDAMVARIDKDMKAKQQALEIYQQNRVRDFGLLAGAGIIGLLVASLWVALSSITGPLNRVRNSIIRISEGAYDTLVPAETKDDEIGQIWGAVAILKDRAAEADRLTREKLESEHKLRELVLD
jgi:HAMP domain-containing protein